MHVITRPKSKLPSTNVSGRMLLESLECDMTIGGRWRSVSKLEVSAEAGRSISCASDSLQKCMLNLNRLSLHTK